MTKSKFIRLGGWSFMLGAVAFLPGLIIIMLEYTGYRLISNWDSSLAIGLSFGFFLSPLLFAVGMLGLRARYGDETGSLGRNILALGAIGGGILITIGDLVQFSTTDYSVSNRYFFVFLGGVLLLFYCLFIFGVLTIQKKLLPRWNGLPFIAGLGIPFFPILGEILSSNPVFLPSTL